MLVIHISNAYAVDFFDDTGYIPDWAVLMDKYQALEKCSSIVGDTTKDGEWCLQWAAYVSGNGESNTLLDNFTQGANLEQNCVENYICAFPGGFLEYAGVYSNDISHPGLMLMTFAEPNNETSIAINVEKTGYNPSTTILDKTTGMYYVPSTNYTSSSPLEEIVPLPVEKSIKSNADFMYLNYTYHYQTEQVLNQSRVIFVAHFNYVDGGFTETHYDNQTGIEVLEMDQSLSDGNTVRHETKLVKTNFFDNNAIPQSSQTSTNPAQVSGPIIPQWIKNNAKWWSQGQIGDSDFVKGIQYLVQNGIVKVQPLPGGYLQNSKQIPQWIKNDAGWWTDGTIEDSEFVKGMEYLVQTGIIQVSIVQPVNQTENMPTLQANQTDMDQSSTSIPTSCTALDNGVLPDPNCTPGASDPTVTQDNIDSTICVSGYASSVRPPVSYTEPLKFKLMDAYGYTDSPSNYELDHLIPLEIGGSPTDVKNLWPESHNITPNSYDKDGFENYLHDQVCAGKIDLATAQNEIATNWVKYWMIVKNQ